MSKPKHKIEIKWSPNFAYAIGLIATDGNLSPNGRSINFTSKDKALIETFLACLKIFSKIGKKSNGSQKKKKYFVVQIGDVNFYRFLMSIRIMPAKSKILSQIDIPDKYFFDFLRGHFDGDGTFYSYWDPRWKSSFMFYTEFVSASKKHILWLRSKIENFLGIKGHLTNMGKGATCQLKYAKNDSLKLLPKIYYRKDLPCLLRKNLKIKTALGIIDRRSLI